MKEITVNVLPGTSRINDKIIKYLTNSARQGDNTLALPLMAGKKQSPVCKEDMLSRKVDADQWISCIDGLIYLHGSLHQTTEVIYEEIKKV